MIETIWSWVGENVAPLFTVGGLTGIVVAIKQFWGLKSKVVSNVDTQISSMKDTVIAELKSEFSKQVTDSESTMIQRINIYKDKVYSSYLSEERKTHYLQLAKDELEKAKETYGTIIPLPNTIQDVENI